MISVLVVLTAACTSIGQLRHSFSPIRPLTSDDQYHEDTPAVSPDGSRVVFARRAVDGSGRYRLWAIPSSGGEATPLTPAEFPYDCTRPSWSPDGHSVAFSGSPDEDQEDAPTGIWLIDVRSLEIRQVTDPDRFSDLYPQWLPDGKHLVICRAMRGETNRDLWLLSLDGTARRITSQPGFDCKSTISPDGHRVAFASERPAGAARRVWSLELAVGEASTKPLTRGSGKAPAWSPDGRWIAFVAYRASTPLYITSPSGGAVFQITQPGLEAENPEWFPDSRSIVLLFRAAEGRPYHVGVVDLPSHLLR